MRARRRHSLAFIVSSILHASVLLWGAIGFAPQMPEIDFDFELQEVELIDPDALQGEEAQPEAEPPGVEEPTAPPPAAEPTPEELAEQEEAEKKRKEEEERKRKEEEEKKKREEEAKKFARRGSEADQLAPPTSTVHVLLVPKRVRKLPFAETAVDLLAPWPDFELLVSKGGFDVLRDFDHIMIASPDIRDWRQTFLAVDFKMSTDEVKAAIERAVKANGETIEWIEDGKILRGNPKPIAAGEPDIDDRWFVILPDKIALYVHDKFLEHVLAGPKGEGKTAGNFVANLSDMRKFAERQPGAGVQLVLTDIQSAFKLRRGIEGLPLEAINAFEVSVEAARDPEMVVRIGFSDVASAKIVETFWTERVKQLIDKNLTTRIFVGPIYDQTTIERDGDKVTLRAELTEAQVVQVLEMVAKTSARMTKKSPEQMEKLRAERLENWKKRNRGKLPPGALDGPRPSAPTPTPDIVPSAPPTDDVIEEEPPPPPS